MDLCAASGKVDLAAVPVEMQNAAYKELLMKETSHEVEDREDALSDEKMSDE